MTESVAADDIWRRCNGCKGPIGYEVMYWTCSVSTCNRKRTALYFCSVSCWEIHLPVARHRESWAEEQWAPTRREAARAARAEPASAKPSAPRRIIPKPTPRSAAPAPASSTVPREVLVITSRMKDYVRATSGFNTSERVLGPLSDILREVCDQAVRNAAKDERRTVLDRDIPKRIRIED